MARVRCNACNGEYDTVDGRGIPYFHACPPLTLVRVIRLGAEQDIPLADLQPSDQVTVINKDGKRLARADAMQPDDERDSDRYVERADARDENQFVTFQDEFGRAFTRPLKDGPGRTAID
jgi:hypothetical protein